MNTASADFNSTASRPGSSKLAALLRALADMFDAKSIEKAQTAQKLETFRTIHGLAGNYEAVQPNLAAELRFIASRG